MEKFKRIGTLATGVIIGVVLSIGATAFAAGTIKSAEYNSNKVLLNGEELKLAAPLISIVEEETPQNTVNYMLVRAVLEAMGYVVSWDAASNSINIVSPVEKPVASAPLAKITMGGSEVTAPNPSGSAPIVGKVRVNEIAEPLTIREVPAAFLFSVPFISKLVYRYPNHFDVLRFYAMLKVLLSDRVTMKNKI